MIQNFSSKKIVVLGDVMLDKYIFGSVDRISPEAPIPIVSVNRETFVPGGAANTASNITALSGKAFLIGVVGNDPAHDLLVRETNKNKINTDDIVVDSRKRTVQKIRVLGQSQQLLRIDYDDEEYIESSTEKKIISAMKNHSEIHAFVISDYAKGVITEEVMKEVHSFVESKKIPLIVDPKPQNRNWYQNATLITPNKKEAEGMLGRKISNAQDVERAGLELSEVLNAHILITMGEKGMSLFEKGQKPFHIPTEAREVYDVSGAGDTVVATVSLAISCGASLKEASILANRAAGIKVKKLGTAPVTAPELLASCS
ncbi:MAG: D-glycero-beta-D-manno-heptose-7-phosphate kinase [Deltaproteobacteria bacterium]|nr:D-glycero-beta-D-manno-heptose-7-phosphate kinase [Deltaproteobacteria bacterium]